MLSYLYIFYSPQLLTSPNSNSTVVRVRGMLKSQNNRHTLDILNLGVAVDIGPAITVYPNENKITISIH